MLKINYFKLIKIHHQIINRKISYYSSFINSFHLLNNKLPLTFLYFTSPFLLYKLYAHLIRLSQLHLRSFSLFKPPKIHNLISFSTLWQPESFQHLLFCLNLFIPNILMLWILIVVSLSDCCWFLLFSLCFLFLQLSLILHQCMQNLSLIILINRLFKKRKLLFAVIWRHLMWGNKFLKFYEKMIVSKKWRLTCIVL